MSDLHRRSYDDFDLRVNVNDNGEVTVVFEPAGAWDGELVMDYTTLRDALQFVAIHGLGMKRLAESL